MIECVAPLVKFIQRHSSEPTRNLKTWGGHAGVAGLTVQQGEFERQHMSGHP